MAKNQPNSHQPSPLIQFLVNFAIPIFILMRLSSESKLGATKGMLLALAFPVAFEIYNVIKRKKISILSVIAISGILVTGLVSLLGLSEQWLAVRRSVPYLAFATAIFISIQIKHSLLEMILPQILDMDKVALSVSKNKKQKELKKIITLAGYLVCGLFVAITITSYVLTRIVIVSHTGTTGFNEEYARLRLLSLPFTSLPTLLSLVGIIMYMLWRIEKLTGLEMDKLLKKNK